MYIVGEDAAEEETNFSDGVLTCSLPWMAESWRVECSGLTCGL